MSSFLYGVHELINTLHAAESFKIGIKDSLNPYVLLAVLIFVFLFYLVKKDKLPINIFCAFFLIGYIAGVVGLVSGNLDVFLSNLVLTRIIQVSNVLVGIFFVYIGLINLKGWWQLKKNKAFNQLAVKATLFFSDETIKGKSLNQFRRNTLKFGSLCWGVLTALLGAAWGPDKDLYIMVSVLSDGDNNLKGCLGIAVYGIVQAWMLFFVWFLYLYIQRSNSSKLWVERNISIIKIATSAIFLSVGLGMTYISIK